MTWIRYPRDIWIVVERSQRSGSFFDVADLGRTARLEHMAVPLTSGFS